MTFQVCALILHEQTPLGLLQACFVFNLNREALIKANIHLHGPSSTLTARHSTSIMGLIQAAILVLNNSWVGSQRLEMTVTMTPWK
jgi:hypothetical protein